MEKQIKLSAEEYAEHVEIDGLLNFILDLEKKRTNDLPRGGTLKDLQDNIFHELTDRQLLQLTEKIAGLIEEGKDHSELLKRIIEQLVRREGWTLTREPF